MIAAAQTEMQEYNKDVVIFCDRGVLDGAAYCNDDMWSQVCEEANFDPTNFADKRYDAVLHMVTAADGAEEFYDLSNESRYENIDQARDRDAALRKLYIGHRKYFMIDNKQGNFHDKISRTANLVKSVLGLKTKTKTFRKYLIDLSDFISDQKPKLEGIGNDEEFDGIAFHKDILG